MSGSSLYRTKLCNMFMKTGSCSKPNCTFAHGNAELRRPGESAFTGQRHNLGSDLRVRLGRQFSPERRPSLDRSGRRVQRFSGYENPRPFDKPRDNDYRENHRFNERNGYAGGLKVVSRIEDRAEDGRNNFLGYNNALEEQLKDIDLDVKKLTGDKRRLEDSFERKAQEVDVLTSRVQVLETQLDREKEECRRITSSTKKFVKEYNRFLRAQDDLKRSEARLQKLVNQFSPYLGGSEGNNRDADVDIISDEENDGRNLRTSYDPQNELQNTSLSRKKHHVDQYTTKEPVEDGLIGEEEKVEKDKKRPSRWNMNPSKSYSEEESGAWNDEDAINKSSSKEDNWKRRRRLSIGTSSIDKVMSSTCMAALEVDEVADFDEENPEAAKGSPLISLPPPPPPPLRDTHFQGDKEDVIVDVMEQRKANDVDSV